MEQGSQVTPITDQEITTMRSLFEKFANTLVDASHFRTEIEELRNTIEGVRREAELLRSKNRELDEHLVVVREQRDRAYAERDQAHHEVDDLRRELAQAEERAKKAEGDASWQGQNIVNARREAEDAQLKVMELEERLNKARDWIKTITSLFASPPEV